MRVFEHEPDLLAGVDVHSAQVLRDRCVARVTRLEPGQWDPVSPSPEDARGALGLLVIHGALARYVHLDGRPSPELVTTGDLLRPWDPAVEVEQTAASSWRVLTPTELAALDARFAATVARWPTITSQLVSRALQRSRMLAFLHAVAQTRRAEDRMLILLRLLGDRCGKVTPEGVVIPLPLTHEVLGELVCVRRPTASTALGQLVRAGLIQRRPDRTWLIRRQCAADGSPVAA